MMRPISICLALLLLITFVFPYPSLIGVQAGWLDDSDDDHDHDSSDSEEDFTTVTYGSAVRLVHKPSSYKLHSHNIKWGSGSGQQSVTGFQGDGDANSLWTIRSAYSPNPATIITPAPSGSPVRCNDVIRFLHVTTKKYLHSHLHQSPLTKRQEISGYGENGESDTGDNWKVECVNPSPRGVWLRGDVDGGRISFLHVDTGKRLYTRKADAFDNNNCRGCPIVGQLELSAHSTTLNDDKAHWFTGDGYYFPIIEQTQVKQE